MKSYWVMIAGGKFGSNKNQWSVLEKFDTEQEAIVYKNSWLNPIFTDEEIKVIEVKN